MAYYCCDCGEELSTAWVEMWFVPTDNIQCQKCHKVDEQLNKDRVE